MFKGLTEKATNAAKDATQKVVDAAGDVSEKATALTSEQYAKRVDQLLELMEVTARRAAKKKGVMSNVVISAELRLGIGAISIEADFDLSKFEGETE